MANALEFKFKKRFRNIADKFHLDNTMLCPSVIFCRNPNKKIIWLYHRSETTSAEAGECIIPNTKCATVSTVKYIIIATWAVLTGAKN